MQRQALITGADGFTGKYVCDEFINHGWSVWKAGLAKTNLNQNYVNINLCDESSLSNLRDAPPFNAVIHLAAASFIDEKDTTSHYRTNLLGTKFLLDELCLHQTAPDCVIFASSGTVYGEAMEGHSFTELDSVNPINHYGVSKIAMEHLIRLYSEQLRTVVVRPFNYTGIGQSHRFLIPKIVRHLLERKDVIEPGNLNVARDFSDVRDIARAYRLLAESPPVGETINLCSGASVKLRDCLELAMKISEWRPEIKVNEQLIRVKDTPDLRGCRRKLSALLPDFENRPFSETLTWMLTQ